MSELKIIVCTDGIFPNDVGGMQRHSRFLIEHLAKSEKTDLTVIHPYSEKIFRKELGINEINILPIDKSKNYLLECYKYSKRVYAVLKAHPEHIIYAQGLTVWYNIKKVSARLIVNPHGLEPYQTITFKEKLIAIPFKWIFNYIFKHASRVVSLGGELTAILKKHVSSSGKIITLPNAVLLPGQIQKQKINDKLNIMFVARFAHNKGIHILIKAIEELNAGGYADKIIYNLGGKGPLFDHYSNGYNFQNLNYLGFVSDEQLFMMYRSNDLFVLPTLFEGMPTVVLEAMSYGLPVIVSDVGATSVLVDLSNGYLIRRNDVDELKKAITSFYNLSEEERNRLSENSYLRVKSGFTWDKVAEMHIDEFRILNLADDKK